MGSESGNGEGKGRGKGWIYSIDGDEKYSNDVMVERGGDNHVFMLIEIIIILVIIILTIIIIVTKLTSTMLEA